MSHRTSHCQERCSLGLYAAMFNRSLSIGRGTNCDSGSIKTTTLVTVGVKHDDTSQQAMCYNRQPSLLIYDVGFAAAATARRRLLILFSGIASGIPLVLTIVFNSGQANNRQLSCGRCDGGPGGTSEALGHPGRRRSPARLAYAPLARTIAPPTE